MLKAMLVKEFWLISRDKHALAALFVLPAVFILIMSLALRDTFGSERALIGYAVVDRDGSETSRKLASFLAESGALAEQNLSLADDGSIRDALEGPVQFVLTIPEGFAEHVFDDAYAQPLLRLDAGGDAKSELIELFRAQTAAALVRLRMGKLKADLKPFLGQKAARLDTALSDAQNGIETRFAAMQAGEKPTSTQQSVPSWIVFGMFFVIIPMSTIFISERRQNTLMRMSAMNISLPALFAGKIAPYMLINQLQVWVMIAVGVYLVPLFGADALTLGGSVGGIFLVSLGLSLAAIGTSVLIAVSVSTVEQATTIGGIINVLMGAVGGIMVPKFVMPPSMQAFADVSPMSWGLEGFLDLFLRGRGIADVAGETAALALYGMGLLLLSALIFSYKQRRGV